MSLWKRFLFLKYKSSPQICTQNKHKRNQGTSLCTCRKASLTVEAAVVVPVVIGFLSLFLYLFQVIQVQASIEEALFYTGRQLALESYLISSEEALFLSAEAYMIAALGEDASIESHVKNGVLGINLTESEFQDSEIILRACYEVELPVAFFEIKTIRLASENCFRKWIGDISLEEDWVYVTENGSVYHAEISCRAIDLSVKEVSLTNISSLRGQNGQKYYPCSRCVEDGLEKIVVYCTDYGRLYHGDINCSSLKRSIKRVQLSEVEGKSPCSFCYE